VTNEVLRFRRRSDGEEFWSSVSSTPIFDADGTVRFVITIYHDITERRQEGVTQAYLGEVSRLIGATLDIDSALEAVAHGAVPAVADWCIIDRLEEDKSLRRILATSDAVSEKQAAALNQRFPLDLDSPHPIAQVIRTGTAMLVDRAWSFGAQIDDILPPPSAIAQRFGYRSCVIAPIIARGRIFGALTLAQAESGRLFNERGRELGIELARRVAVGIDNARLFREAQIAEARVRALSEASRAFSEARLDLQAVLDSVATHVGKLIGDQCIVRLLSDDGDWLTLAAVYREGEERQAELARALLEKPQRVDEGIAGRVMKTGQHFLIPHVDLDDLKQTATPAFARHLEDNPIYSLAIVPLRAHDRLIGSVGVTRERPDVPYSESDLELLNDLADRAALAIENAQLYASARDAVKVREQFLSIASHELKTPLTSVKAASQLLNRFVSHDPPDVARIARIVGQLGGEVNRLESLVFDLLDATKIQQGRLDLRPGHVDLEEVVQQVVARFEHDPVHLSTHIVVVDCPDPVVGTWDSDRLDQVLTNLMSKALKYSPHGGEVRIALRCDGDEAVIEVSDHGLGISADDQAQLFQPFSRGEFVRQSIGGTGLGLYISAQIIERHNGSIALTSEPGKGSTFTIRLPLDITSQHHPE
jgi:signal transduction histidine kinase